MLEIIQSGGWLMLPILLCSVVALAIVLERGWTLRRSNVTPRKLLPQVWTWYQHGELNERRLKQLEGRSYLARVLVACVRTKGLTQEQQHIQIEETGKQVTHQMERFLNFLGTIAEVTPLLGLLGTVVGMIEIFSVITDVGVGDPKVLADGIGQALITTASGIIVAIPALIAHRYFRRKVDGYVVEIEGSATRLVQALQDGPKGDQMPLQLFAAGEKN